MKKKKLQKEVLPNLIHQTECKCIIPYFVFKDQLGNAKGSCILNEENVFSREDKIFFLKKKKKKKKF